MSFFRPIRSESAPTTVKNGIPMKKRDRDHDVRGFDIHFQDGLHIEQSVELSGVPDHALPGRRSEKRNQDESSDSPIW